MQFDFTKFLPTLGIRFINDINRGYSYWELQVTNKISPVITSSLRLNNSNPEFLITVNPEKLFSKQTQIDSDLKRIKTTNDFDTVIEKPSNILPNEDLFSFQDPRIIFIGLISLYFSIIILILLGTWNRDEDFFDYENEQICNILIPKSILNDNTKMKFSYFSFLFFVPTAFCNFKMFDAVSKKRNIPILDLIISFIIFRKTVTTYSLFIIEYFATYLIICWVASHFLFYSFTVIKPTIIQSLNIKTTSNLNLVISISLIIGGSLVSKKIVQTSIIYLLNYSKFIFVLFAYFVKKRSNEQK
jgi:hypothetical protein